MPITTGFQLLSLVSIILPTAYAAVIFSGQTTLIGNISYYVPSSSVSRIELNARTSHLLKGSDLLPFTFVSATTQNFTQKDLDILAAKYSISDDVWQSTFLQGTFLLFYFVFC
jgi:hypothetical protein